MAKKENSKKEVSAETGQDFVDVEVEEVASGDSPESGKKKTSWLLYFFLIVLALVGSIYAAYKYLDKSYLESLLGKEKEQGELLVLQKVETPYVDEEVAAISESNAPIEQADLEYNIDKSDSIVDESLAGEVATIIEDASDGLAEGATEIAQSAGELVGDLAQSLRDEGRRIDLNQAAEMRVLQQQNQNILLYISAQNLQSFLRESDAKKLAYELEFFNAIADENEGYLGKVQILEFALEGGLVSLKTLNAQLDKISAKLDSAKEKTFWENLKGEVFGLIKVTKLDENAEGDDAGYSKILLAKRALDNADLEKAIKHVESIELDAAKEWVKDAYKLVRAEEAADYLVDRARKKLLTDATNSLAQ